MSFTESPSIWLSGSARSATSGVSPSEAPQPRRRAPNYGEQADFEKVRIQGRKPHDEEPKRSVMMNTATSSAPTGTASTDSPTANDHRDAPVFWPVTGRRHGTFLIVTTTQGRLFIVCSVVARDDTQIVSVCPMTGTLQYRALAGMDLFPSEASACEYLLSQGHRISRRKRAYALIGYLVVGRTANLCVADDVRRDLALFGGHVVNTVLSSVWIKVKLSYPSPPIRKSEEHNLQQLCSFVLDELHFFCETADVTRAFPSTHRVDDYDREFCWNHQLAEPFAQLGMRAWCAVLLQGMARSQILKHAVGGRSLSMAMITRKSMLNPGTRYNARGLNERAAPGNECECELIVWSEPCSQEVVQPATASAPATTTGVSRREEEVHEEEAHEEAHEEERADGREPSAVHSSQAAAAAAAAAEDLRSVGGHHRHWPLRASASEQPACYKLLVHVAGTP
mmetsp:Transcript_18976/g.56880  ORF Transcript_18976/g.56880 Transcript_18976/m.56880 type:complete len:452 (-) Transcript_18976:2122-3477(-)